ncbi:MAG TPA: hypothetical protein VGW78_03700 [Candidatus Babeliales bacterium]|jgi:dihydrodipicolinate reductase|nr:hypothetical protein [Candidatus Babeliales bacterium]
MKLNTYLMYAILASSISLITEISAYTVRVVNQTDGAAKVIVDIAAPSLICQNADFGVSSQKEVSIGTGGCCVKAIRIQGLTGSIKDQTAEKDFGIACRDINVKIKKDNDNRMTIEFF